MKMLGLNPMEQEIVDVTNEIARNGLIYFPEFCHVVHTRYRAMDEDVFRQNMFKVNISYFFAVEIRIKNNQEIFWLLGFGLLNYHYAGGGQY